MRALLQSLASGLASGAPCLALSLALVLSLPALASDLPDPFAGIGVEPHLGISVPAHLQFRDENGSEIRLSDYLGHRPVILAPVYYRCPNLCGSTLADLASTLQRVPLSAGRDYEIVAVSIDPREQPADAVWAKSRAMADDGSAGLRPAAHFLTGSETAIAELMRSIGFHYRWDPQLQQYAHVSGIVLLTPDGHLARWLAGVGLQPQDLRLAVAEAGRSGIGGVVDRFLLLCYHYDPQTGQYARLIDRALKIGAGLTVLATAAPIAIALRRERRRQRPRGTAVL
jgi:protein SCO1